MYRSFRNSSNLSVSYSPVVDIDLGAALVPERIPTWLLDNADAPTYQNVTLAWSANTEPDLAGYHVYRSTASGSGYIRLTGPPQTTTGWVDSPPSDPSVTAYYYVITAVDTSGNESGYSAQVSSLGVQPIRSVGMIGIRGAA